MLNSRTQALDWESRRVFIYISFFCSYPSSEYLPCWDCLLAYLVIVMNDVIFFCSVGCGWELCIRTTSTKPATVRKWARAIIGIVSNSHASGSQSCICDTSSSQEWINTSPDLALVCKSSLELAGCKTQAVGDAKSNWWQSNWWDVCKIQHWKNVSILISLSLEC